MTATKLADAALTEVRLKANITFWLIAVRRKLKDTTDPAQRDYLAKLYAEFARRLPA